MTVVVVPGTCHGARGTATVAAGCRRQPCATHESNHRSTAHAGGGRCSARRCGIPLPPGGCVGAGALVGHGRLQQQDGGRGVSAGCWGSAGRPSSGSCGGGHPAKIPPPPLTFAVRCRPEVPLRLLAPLPTPHTQRRRRRRLRRAIRAAGEALVALLGIGVQHPTIYIITLYNRQRDLLKVKGCGALCRVPQPEAELLAEAGAGTPVSLTTATPAGVALAACNTAATQATAED